MMLDDERAKRLDRLRGNRFIKYSRGQFVLSAMEDIFNAKRTHRMPNLLLVSETNNGKTMLARRFAKRHAAELHLSSASTVPVLYVQAPPVPDESRFFNAILTELFQPFRASSRADIRQLQVLRILDEMNVRVMLIDEIHHILAGPVAKQRHFLNMLKYLGNELMIPIIAIGTRDAFNAVQSDPQFANRFEPLLLPRWQMDEDLLRLLASFETELPLQAASNLTDPELALKILTISEGTIGEMAQLLKRAARKAIESGEERISAAILSDCGYVSPSDRKRVRGIL